MAQDVPCGRTATPASCAQLHLVATFPLMCHATGFSCSLCLEFTFFGCFLFPDYYLCYSWRLNRLLYSLHLLSVPLPPWDDTSRKFQMSVTYGFTASCTFLIVVIVHYSCNFHKLPQRNCHVFVFVVVVLLTRCVFGAQGTVSSTLTHSRC